MGDYTPKFLNGDETSWLASTVLTGGQLVELTGAGTCGATTAASAVVLGVASRDTAVGARLTVVNVKRQWLTAAGAITAGAPVKSAANGRITTYVVGTDPVTQYLGTALTAASAAGDVVDVLWRG